MTRDVLNTCSRSWGTTPGFEIAYDMGPYVLDVDVNDGGRKLESDSGITFPVVRRALEESLGAKRSKIMK